MGGWFNDMHTKDINFEFKVKWRVSSSVRREMFAEKAWHSGNKYIARITKSLFKWNIYGLGPCARLSSYLFGPTQQASHTNVCLSYPRGFLWLNCGRFLSHQTFGLFQGRGFVLFTFHTWRSGLFKKNTLRMMNDNSALSTLRLL